MTGFLEVAGLAKDFGGIHAIADLSLDVAEGELLCIIGPNGCGKSTFFNLITGQFAPTSGRIRFRGNDIAGVAPHRISRLGIGRKFQVPRVYEELTVRQNLDVPIYAEAAQRGLHGILRRPDPGPEAGELLRLTRLGDKAAQPAGELSHGEKQWLEIAMLLATRPRLMLLDEPTSGMTAAETEATAALIQTIHRKRGTAIIVIEHDMGFVGQLACPVAVMMRGTLLCRGSLEEVSANPVVREAYLGSAALA